MTELANPQLHRNREGRVERRTGETDITLTVNLDGNGRVDVATGVPFLDHMLDAMGRHGRLDLYVRSTGDSEMDPHHTVEDVGIALGQAIRQALGDRSGIIRYGHAYAPLDEALARVVVDCSGRPYLEFVADMPEPMVTHGFNSSLVEEFWRGLVMNAALTVHIDLVRARNAHHAAEAIFKAGALAIRAATRSAGDPTYMPSTKGVLA